MLRHAILLTLSLVFSAPLLAANFTVTRSDDPAPDGCANRGCSLREALMEANALAGRDRVVLGAATYSLTRLANGVQNDERVGPLWVSDTTDFVGVGAGTNQTHVRWSTTVVADSPVFRVWNQGDETPVTWSRMKISHGRHTSNGGCLQLQETYSTYTLDRVIVRDCQGGSGGAIGASQATLVLLDTVIEFNQATYDGGGIHQGFDATLITSRSRIRSNTAGRDGGGIAFTHHFLSAATTTFWTDDGTSSVTSNVAARNGGGLVVSGDTSLVLDGSDPDSGSRLNFGKNQAGAAGGAIARGPRFVAIVRPRLDLEQVSIGYNSAPIGGGVHAVLPVAIDAAEFRGNSTTPSGTGGQGGGVYLQVQDGASTISRSSFWLNDAGATAGGALYSSGCSPLALHNVSMHRNSAARGAAIHGRGALELRHVTAIDNNGVEAELFQDPGPGAACGDAFAMVANSLIGDRCSARYLTTGGNQYGPDAIACSATASDQRQANDAVFGLVAGIHGGAFTVMGWNSDGVPRPQRDFGLGANCVADDVRGLPRNDSFCDAGAFEQQP